MDMPYMEIDWLPLGSVVMLRDTSRPLVIYGRMQRDMQTGRVWEYAAAVYPEGNPDSMRAVMFDGPDIEYVLHLGFRDRLELEFCKYLDEYSDERDEEAADGI